MFDLFFKNLNISFNYLYGNKKNFKTIKLLTEDYWAWVVYFLIKMLKNKQIPDNKLSKDIQGFRGATEMSILKVLM